MSNDSLGVAELTSLNAAPGADSVLQGRVVRRYAQGELNGSFRCAVVHDWLPVYAGAERVLESILELFPNADVFSLIDFLSPEDREFLRSKTVTTSLLQRLPFARRHYRRYLPLAPLLVEQFDLREYDLVISSSYVVAKGILTRADQLHISYVHSPIRYAWDLHFDYLETGNLQRGLKGAFARAILHYLRLYDVATANRVDVYVANSRNVAQRIWKTYRRPAYVVYPPIDIDAFSLEEEKDDFYVTMSRLVPYKRIDLIVAAFNKMPDKELIVIGDGPEYKRIAALAGRNVTVLGFQPLPVVRSYLQRAKAFVFAADEDFGIVTVEAQACGTPVIAYGRGGSLETVTPGETGLLFNEQSVASLRAAVEDMERRYAQFEPARIRRNAERFSKSRFREAFERVISRERAAFTGLGETADFIQESRY